MKPDGRINKYLYILPNSLIHRLFAEIRLCWAREGLFHHNVMLSSSWLNGSPEHGDQKRQFTEEVISNKAIISYRGAMAIYYVAGLR